MRTIKLTLEYDGTGYFGFQRQKHHPTIQSELESALKKLFQKKITAYPAGRTDSGVHAEGQIVHFRIASSIPLFKIQAGLNTYLPREIAVTKIEEAPSSFHARFSAKRKIYIYHVLNSKARSPLERFRSFHVPYPLSLSKMKQAARIFVGTHDFRAFESSGGRRKSAVRTIYRFAVQKKGSHIYFMVESDGFLYRMVRSLVGTLLAAGSNRLSLKELKKTLLEKNRKGVGQTVPPQGLLLKQVAY